jgi:hypothetical protein
MWGIACSVLLCLGAVFLPAKALAYNPHATHRALTQESLKLFEYNTPGVLSAADKAAIEKGSDLEDDLTRSLNHFYDPINDRGILGNLTSKAWAENGQAQALYEAGVHARIDNLVGKRFDAPNDYSFDRAVFDYVHGDRIRGLEGLGHVLHLIQDASVPDHTRNDAHPPMGDSFLHESSPYEAFARKFTTTTIDVAAPLLAAKAAVPRFDSLGVYFDSIARYSNMNFWSKDSITAYADPKPVGEREVRLSDGVMYRFAVSGLGANLGLVTRSFDPDTGEPTRSYSLRDRDNIVLSDYWRLLSRQAVLHGAGVTELFFREVSKERQTQALLKENKTFLARLAGNIASAFDQAKSLALGEESPVDAPELQPLGQAVLPPLPSASSLASVKKDLVPAVAVPEPPVASAVQSKTTPPAPVPQEYPVISPNSQDAFAAVPDMPYPGFGGGSPASYSDQKLAVSGAAPSGGASADGTTGPAGSGENNAAATGPLNAPATTSASRSVDYAAMPVVINEIAWAGTEASAQDEWVELYNRTDQLIDLSDVYLAAADGVPFLRLSGSIPPLGYYLIERSNDETVGGVAADLTVPFGTGLSNDGEELRLIHAAGGASTTLDRTPASDVCAGWCGGIGSPAYFSMERKSADVSGADASNWKSNNGVDRNGTDVAGHSLNGTPKQPNSLGDPSSSSPGSGSGSGNITPTTTPTTTPDTSAGSNLGPAEIGYYCPPYNESYVDGGYYIPNSGGLNCHYLSPGIESNKYGGVYKGVPGSPTVLVNSHFLGTAADRWQPDDSLDGMHPRQGDNFFTVIYEVGNTPTPLPRVVEFERYLVEGGEVPLGMYYGIIRWKYGVSP